MTCAAPCVTLASRWAWWERWKFEARIKELVENLPDLAVLVEPLLLVRRVLREQFSILHRRLLAIVRDDLPCHRRRARTLPKLQGGRGGVWADAFQVSIR